MVALYTSEGCILSLMLSVMMGSLLVAFGAQADVCVDDRRLEEGLFGVWEALSAFD